MVSAKQMFDQAVASIDINNPENWKWAAEAYNGHTQAEAIRAIAYEAISDVLAETELNSREQRAIRNEIRLMVIENSHVFNVASYLIKNEITAIKKIVLANI